MARKEDFEEDYEPKKSKKGKRFLNKKRAVIIVILVFGILIGFFLTHYIIEPIISTQQHSSLKSCQSKVNLLDNQLDECYACLGENGIEISSCTQ